jgi:hypothetical protein
LRKPDDNWKKNQWFQNCEKNICAHFIGHKSGKFCGLLKKGKWSVYIMLNLLENALNIQKDMKRNVDRGVHQIFTTENFQRL